MAQFSVRSSILSNYKFAALQQHVLPVLIRMESMTCWRVFFCRRSLVGIPVEQADRLPFKTVPDKLVGIVVTVGTGRKAGEVNLTVLSLAGQWFSPCLPEFNGSVITKLERENK